LHSKANKQEIEAQLASYLSAVASISCLFALLASCAQLVSYLCLLIYVTKGFASIYACLYP
jgi:hypothetical protein